MKRLMLLVGAVALAFQLEGIRAQAVTNGSVTGAPAANSGINAGSAAGWTVCGFSPDLCNVSFPSYSGNSQVARVASPDGGTWLGLAALGECAQTTITGLTVGQNYTLYFCGANFGTAALFNSSPGAPIIQVGTATTTLSIPMLANTWNAYSLAFNASATSMTLRCSIPNGSNAYVSLDGFNLSGSLCNPVPLAVEFVSFTGRYEDCAVVLDWASPEDEPAFSYEIQRSSDGGEFETLDKLEVHEALSGRWVDSRPLPSAEYRIRMYNETGRHLYSQVLPVRGRCRDARVLVEDNPVNDPDMAWLNLTGGSSEVAGQRSDVVLEVRDVEGRLVATHTLEVEPEAWTRFGLPVSGWKRGLYFIRTSAGAQAKLVLR